METSMDVPKTNDQYAYLTKLKAHYIDMAGEWNGEDVKGEERAGYANDIAEKCDELLDLLDAYDNA